MAPKVHTFEEVASHNKKDDCWLIISGKVYNVTPFLEEHPGGDEVLLTSTEKDATNDFEDVGHSDDAKVTMQKFYIGEIDESTLPSEQKYTPPPSATSTANQDSGSSSKILLFILPLLILGLAFVLRLYSKKE
ncbi:cytochrome b5-like [Olea europaea var. sylvestris]|uniref:Cytochrome b5 n=1 Tax=Olea europaea subsp. europaea TaxID=158383 RepID=A0A8S0QCZ2_OLEEU|nr:cytochrome b5-like [Olea europaea var. sylvestris]CAA2965322.1 cytochrome b5 [Olea europaea subsp. europaea]